MNEWMEIMKHGLYAKLTQVFCLSDEKSNIFYEPKKIYTFFKVLLLLELNYNIVYALRSCFKMYVSG